MNRRKFLFSVPLVSATAMSGAVTPRIQYVTEAHEIEVQRRLAGKWKVVQRVASERPTSLVRSKLRDILFAVNEVGEYNGLPSGSVQSFAIEPQSGRLTPLSTRLLSLASTFPRACALAPDERYLAVAAFGGGTINLLPVSETGVIEAPCSVKKEIGSGAHPVHQRTAHPHSLAFDRSGRFLAVSDFGSDRVSVFSVANGELVLADRHVTRPGSGPGRIEIDPFDDTFTVSHELSGGNSRHSWPDRS